MTKLPPVPEQVPHVAAWINQQVAHSHARLGLGTHALGDLLLHRPSQLQGPMSPSLLGTLRDLQLAGAAEASGVSINGPCELTALMAPHPPEVIESYFEALDPIFGLIKFCQQGGNGVQARLRGPICHAGFKRLN